MYTHENAEIKTHTNITYVNIYVLIPFFYQLYLNGKNIR